MPSSSVLKRMHRKRLTKHENETSKLLQKEGLSCPIPIQYADIGTGSQHEFFSFESFIRILSLHQRLPLLLGHVNDFSMVAEFWDRYRIIEPAHPIYTTHANREKYVIPCFLHSDEGRTLKKSQIMVFNLQPVLGGNPEPEYDVNEMHTNMKFHSFATRFLLATMCKKVYRENSQPFYKLLEAIAADLLRLWEKGVEVQFREKSVRLHVCVVAVKGDWPALAKMGCMERWFGRAVKKRDAHGAGICHLCLAGCPDIPFHAIDREAEWRKTVLTVDPFKTPSPLSCLPNYGPMLYRFDVFHTAHKGILAELAGSALARLPDYFSGLGFRV